MTYDLKLIDKTQIDHQVNCCLSCEDMFRELEEATGIVFWQQPGHVVAFKIAKFVTSPGYPCVMSCVFGDDRHVIEDKILLILAFSLLFPSSVWVREIQK